MKNIITAQIEFYFKGEKFTPNVTLDLNEQMEAHGGIPNLRSLLATKNSINPYSYEFEVMEITPVTIGHAEGMVSEFVSVDKQLDIEGFEKQWHENKVLGELQTIAKNRLDVDDLINNEAIELALLDAYTLGKNVKAM